MTHELHPALQATNRFQVKECLGSGGFGVVFEVYDTEANAHVALKWLRNSDASTLARFKREFRSLADLAHPNLVRFRELITVGGEWFFTMDLVAGNDLIRYVRTVSAGDGTNSESTTSVAEDESSDTVQVNVNAITPAPRSPKSSAKTQRSSVILDGHRPLCGADLRRVRGVFVQLGTGLAALHVAGMIHRDIKPSNVLVRPDGRVVILDLGLVTEIGSDGLATTMTGNVVGTPAYMSPEQATGAPCTPASDWYSVGIILYQALTGRVPFDRDPKTLLLKKQYEDPPSPSDLVRGVPKALSELCLDLLARGPERRPTGAEFLARIRAAIPIERGHGETTLETPVNAAPGGFFGREAHLWALEEALDETERGKTVLSFVHGKSGMGKTALVRHFLDNLRKERADILVLEGRCYERESVPYKAVDSLVDSICRYLKRLPPVEAAKLMPRDQAALARMFPVFLELDAPERRGRARLDVLQERRRAFDALRELIIRIADRGPVVLFIDDLQWGDRDSEPLLTTLFHGPEPPPLLFIISYRTEDAAMSPLVQALRRLAAAGPIEACEIPVGELSPEDAEELAGVLLHGHGNPSLAPAVARESYGSPLFVKQLAALRSTSQNVDLGTALRQRVDALTREGRSVLEILAVAGRPVSVAVAARAADVEEDIQGVLAKLRSETLVRTRGGDASDEIEIYHDRIREAVLAELGEAKVKSLHRKLAGVLSTTGDADPEDLALHFSIAEERGLAVEYAEKAARRAAESLAFGRAAEMYEMAIGLSSTLGRNATDLVERLAEALVSAGRGRDAAERFLQAARKATPVDALELRRRAAEQLLFSGRIDEGLKVIDEILSAMGLRTPTTPLGVLCSLVWRRFLLFLRGFRFRERSADSIPRDHLVRIDVCFSLGLGLGMVDTIRGADFQTRYLLLALRAGEPVRIAKGLALEAAYRAGDGVRALPMVERLLARSNELATRVGQPHTRALTTMMSGIARVLLGDWTRGLALCDRAHAELRENCTGVAWELDNAAFFAAYSLLASGRLRQLGERLPSLLEDARSRGDLYAEVFLRMQCDWFLKLAHDDVAGARSDLDAIPEEWNRDRFLLQNVWQMVNGTDILLYAGRPVDAWRLIFDRWPRVEASMFLRPETMRVRATNARARAALGAAARVKVPSDKKALIAIAQDAARKLSREKWPLARGFQLLIEAGVSALNENAPKAAERLRSAIPELEATESHLYAHAARLRLGQLLDDEEGRALVAQACRDLRNEGVAQPETFSFVFVPFKAVGRGADTSVDAAG